VVTEDKPKQSLVSFMRELRKVLPADVKKVSATEYLIAQRAKVSLNYFCISRLSGSNTSKEDQHKDCYPASVTITADVDKFNEQLGHHSYARPSAIFRTRSIPKRQDGTFNFESVGVAVTKCVNAFDEYLAKRKKMNEDDEARQKEIENQFQNLESTVRNFAKFERDYNGLENDKGDIEITVMQLDDSPPTEGFSFDLELRNLGLLELHEILIHAVRIKELYAKTDATDEGTDTGTKGRRAVRAPLTKRKHRL
jgi:hypothetical protein